MGRRIAFACVTRGIETRLFDVVPASREQAWDWVRAQIDQRERDRRVPRGTGAAAERLLSLSGSLEACVTGADLVIETVPENVTLKRKVFAEIGRYASPESLLGTNTSSIPGSALADAARFPERVFNFNWGHIDHLKVEVMPHPGTAPATIEVAVAFVRALGLVPIRDRVEIQGYGTNRIWRAVKKEVLKQLDRGVLGPEDVDRAWMLDWHVPIGPCGLMDQIGLDVIRDIEMIYFDFSGDPSDKPPKLLDDMIAAGKLGVKSGEGFYQYPDPAYQKPGWMTEG